MLMNTFQVPNKPLQGPKTAGAQFYRRFISYPLFQGVRNGMYTAEWAYAYGKITDLA